MKVENIVAAIPMVDVERAKSFYTERLGLELELLSDKLDMFWVKAGDSKFLLYKKAEANKAEHTAMSFTVDNIEKTLEELEHKGIHFYQDNEVKIFDLDGSRSAWFQDTEGNNLEISERP